jgi:hypothetical protein
MVQIPNSILVTLVENTPYSLLYLIEQTQASVPDSSITIPNAGGLTPDLLTDSLNGTALRKIVDFARNHVPMNQASARARMIGDLAPSGPGGDFGQPRAHCTITSRDGSDGWGVDADVDAAPAPGPNPVIVVYAGPNPGFAYLRIKYQHSSDT